MRKSHRDSWKDQALRNIVRAYGKLSVRMANRLRLLSFPRSALDEIVRHLPDSGEVYDVGCGYGLFSIYLAMALPGIRMRGIDPIPSHVNAARDAVRCLALTGVEFEVGDVCAVRPAENVQGIVMFDLISRISRDALEALMGGFAGVLAPGGRLILADIEPGPRHRARWARMLEKLSGLGPRIASWAPGQLHELLQQHGFHVQQHVLPCSRVLYVAEKSASVRGS
jgi:SAM-dependent methyltransferase